MKTFDKMAVETGSFEPVQRKKIDCDESHNNDDKVGNELINHQVPYEYISSRFKNYNRRICMQKK